MFQLDQSAVGRLFRVGAANILSAVWRFKGCLAGFLSVQSPWTQMQSQRMFIVEHSFYGYRNAVRGFVLVVTEGLVSNGGYTIGVIPDVSASIVRCSTLFFRGAGCLPLYHQISKKGAAVIDTHKSISCSHSFRMICRCSRGCHRVQKKLWLSYIAADCQCRVFHCCGAGALLQVHHYLVGRW